MHVVHELFDPYRKPESGTRQITLTGHPHIAEPIVGAFGVFDGVHQGHRMLIGEAIIKAHEMGCRSAILTFDRDPDELFATSHGVRHILTDEDRLALLSTLGADYLFVLPFTRDFSELEPIEFLDSLISFGIDARAVYVGSDFRFGYRAQGNVAILRDWCSLHGCKVYALDLLCERKRTITATRIRGEIEHHSIEEANRLLERTHYIRGYVNKGRGAGKGLGFATANVVPLPDYTCIGDGVYAGYALIAGHFYKAAIAVGVPSTFGKLPHTIEAHILDFSGELYGDEIALYLISFIRPMKTFPSEKELIETVLSNIAWVGENLPAPNEDGTLRSQDIACS